MHFSQTEMAPKMAKIDQKWSKKHKIEENKGKIKAKIRKKAKKSIKIKKKRKNKAF